MASKARRRSTTRRASGRTAAPDLWFLPILAFVAVAACCGLPLLLVIGSSALKGGGRDTMRRQAPRQAGRPDAPRQPRGER